MVMVVVEVEVVEVVEVVSAGGREKTSTSQSAPWTVYVAPASGSFSVVPAAVSCGRSQSEGYGFRIGLSIAAIVATVSYPAYFSSSRVPRGASRSRRGSCGVSIRGAEVSSAPRNKPRRWRLREPPEDGLDGQRESPLQLSSRATARKPGFSGCNVS